MAMENAAEIAPKDDVAFEQPGRNDLSHRTSSENPKAHHDAVVCV